MPTPPRPVTVSLKVSNHTAHLANLDKFDSIPGDYCPILTKYGDRLGHVQAATALSIAAAMWNDVKLTRCSNCADALVLAIRDQTLADLDSKVGPLVRNTRAIDDTDVADLYTFDPDVIRDAAISAILDALTNLTADSDTVHVLSPAAAADPQARKDFYAHLDAMRTVMRKALKDNGYIS